MRTTTDDMGTTTWDRCHGRLFAMGTFVPAPGTHWSVDVVMAVCPGCEDCRAAREALAKRANPNMKRTRP